MNTKTTISISEARKHIFELANEVQAPGTYFTLTEKGRPRVVVMSAEEFESWQETLEVMQDFPNLKKEVKEVERAFKSKAYKQWTTLGDLQKKKGQASKNTKKHAISTIPKAPSRKKPQ